MTKYESALHAMRGEDVNIQEVIGLLFSAMTEGDYRAHYALATWLLHGTHLRKDLKRGVQFLREAASHGHGGAMFDLAVCYETGAGVDKDLAKAFSFYKRAAKSGDQSSRAEVGRMMFYGIGTREDRAGAQRWLAPEIEELAKLSA